MSRCQDVKFSLIHLYYHKMSRCQDVKMSYTNMCYIKVPCFGCTRILTIFDDRQNSSKFVYVNFDEF